MPVQITAWIDAMITSFSAAHALFLSGSHKIVGFALFIIAGG